jgi:hypothetical protein
LVPQVIPEKMGMTACLAPSDRKARLAQLVRLATLVRQVPQAPKARLVRQAATERLAWPARKVLRVPPVILVRRGFRALPEWQAPAVRMRLLRGGYQKQPSVAASTGMA